MTQAHDMGPSALSARILVRGMYVHVLCYEPKSSLSRIWTHLVRMARIGRYYIPAKIRCFHVSGYISRAWKESGGRRKDLSLLEAESPVLHPKRIKLKSDFLEARKGRSYFTRRYLFVL